MQQTIRTAKAKLADAEAKKAVRRAKHYAKAYGKLVWLVTRRAQRHHLFSVIPRDALRMMYAPAPPFPPLHMVALARAESLMTCLGRCERQNCLDH